MLEGGTRAAVKAMAKAKKNNLKGLYYVEFDLRECDNRVGDRKDVIEYKIHFLVPSPCFFEPGEICYSPIKVNYTDSKLMYKAEGLRRSYPNKIVLKGGIVRAQTRKTLKDNDEKNTEKKMIADYLLPMLLESVDNKNIFKLSRNDFNLKKCSIDWYADFDQDEWDARKWR